MIPENPPLITIDWREKVRRGDWLKVQHSTTLDAGFFWGGGNGHVSLQVDRAVKGLFHGKRFHVLIEVVSQKRIGPLEFSCGLGQIFITVQSDNDGNPVSFKKFRSHLIALQRW